MFENEGPQIHPELMEASPIYRGLINTTNDLMSIGVDPAFAAVVVASVPIILRLLRMANEMTAAMIDDWKDNRRIDRKRRELELDQEFGKKGPNDA